MIEHDIAKCVKNDWVPDRPHFRAPVISLLKKAQTEIERLRTELTDMTGLRDCWRKRAENAEDTIRKAAEAGGDE